MHPSLSPTENQVAQSQGWGLFDVFDSGTARWLIQILPLNHPERSAAEAFQTVYHRAQDSDRVAIRALQIMAHSTHTETQKKGKKR